MNKCEHGEKISIFCASECCVWKEAAGCSHCIKKYHNHMGTTIFLQEEDVNALVKKYSLEGTIKPKCRMLQQAVYSYFNLLKTEFANSIDVASKNIVNQIGYPFLYRNNNLSSFKRLKNKEYRKLVQKQFKSLYETSQKITEKELIKEETRIYFEEVKRLEDIVNGLEQAAKVFETAIKKVLGSFNHDTSYITKINDIIKNLNGESPSKATKTKEKQLSPIRYEMKPLQSAQRQSPKHKNLIQTKQNNEETPKVTHITTPPPQLLKPNYARNASIDKKLIKQNKFLALGHTKSLKEKQKQVPSTEVRLINNDKTDLVKQQLNNKELQINQKKRMLIEMMKQKEESIKNAKQQKVDTNKQAQKSTLTVPSYFKRKGSQVIVHKESVDTQKSHEAQANIKTESQERSHCQIDFFDNGLKSNESEVQIKAFTQLPLEMQDFHAQEEKAQVKEKIIIISKPKELQSITEKETINNSPILKKRNSMAIKSQDLQQNAPQLVQQQQFTQELNSEILELKENEQKSLALLLKSITLNAQDGITYLESALAQAQNNLSAAEYLSYLYLEQNKPQNCLHLCNKMLERLENSSDYEELSLIVSNNKAAALNILGRYSQSILILQRCLRFKQKDCLYKNLGDAYFSISIYEKAIYNYEKALVLNENYDQAHYNLAVCLYTQQNYHNARLSIEKAISLQPENEEYQILLSNIDTRITNY